MKRIFAVAALAAALVGGPAKADYFIIDGKNQLKTIRAGTVAITGGTAILPYSTLVDATANPVGTSGNPLFVSLTAGGSSYTVTFGGAIGTLGTPGGFKDGSGNFQALLGDVTNGQWVNLKASVPLSLTGTLPSFGSAQHFICDSGCGAGGGGLSVPYGGAIGANGTPVGFKDGSGNFQPLLGDVTNGQWVLLKNSSIAVTGTFFQATQPISAVSLPLPTGAATAANQTAVAGSASGGTAATSSMLAGGIFNTVAPTLTNGQQASLQLDTNGNLKIAGTVSFSNSSIAVTQATASSLNATVVGTGTFAVQATQAGTWNIGSITTLPALVAGSAIIGKVGIDQTTPGTTNLVAAGQNGTWNITNISGTVSLPTGASTSANQTATQAPVAAATATATKADLVGAQFLTTQPTMTNTQQASLLQSSRGELLVAPGVSGFPVTLTSTTITGTVAVTQSGSWSLAANQSVNVAQINGVTPLMGNGVTGTGSQRVTIASDNTAFSVNATLQASAATAIGKVDPNTIGSWGLQVSTQNSATPTNMMLMAGQFNTTPTTITTGNVSAFQLDNAANLLVNVKTSVLPTGAASSANQTNGTQQSKVTDGTNVAAVKASSTAPVASDPALVVSQSPNAGSAVAQSAPATYSAGQFKYPSILLDGSTPTNGPTYIGPLTCSTSPACATPWAATAVSPYNTLRVQVTAMSGSLLQVQCSNDGSTFSVIQGHWDQTPTTWVNNIFTTGSYLYNINGFKQCKIVTSSYASDTITIALGLTTGPVQDFQSVAGQVTLADVFNNNNLNYTRTSTTAASLVAKNSGFAYLYKFYAVSPTTADHLMIFDAAALPSNGTVTPVACYPTAGGGAAVTDSWMPGPPEQFTNGIVIAFSTGGSCYTLTAASTTGNPFITANVR